MNRNVSPIASSGTGSVFIAGVALVVSASTLVSEFTGFIRLGAGFAFALLLGVALMIPVALAVADLAVSHPRLGGIYQFTRSVVRGPQSRVVALFLSFCFFSTFLVGSSGELLAGAHALVPLLPGSLPAGGLVPLLLVPAVVANLCGFRCTTRLTGALLVVMLGIRWAFGLAGFAGLAATGTWKMANLVPAGGWHWWGHEGIFAAGLALGFWSFVGIEGTASLVEETRNPRRALPRGILLGLGAILLTTVVMGFGVIGTQSPAAWNDLVGASADAPHLAIGSAMFGPAGRTAMAVASVAATWSTLLIALAAVPRMIVAIARDGLFFGRLSSYFAELHPRTGAPVHATLLVVALQLVVSLLQGAVVECLEVAAYLWFFRYLAVLALAWKNRSGLAGPAGLLPRHRLLTVAVVGAGLIVTAGGFGFAGRHLQLGLRASAVAGTALVFALAARALQSAPASRTSRPRIRLAAGPVAEVPVA